MMRPECARPAPRCGELLHCIHLYQKCQQHPDRQGARMQASSKALLWKCWALWHVCPRDDMSIGTLKGFLAACFLGAQEKCLQHSPTRCRLALQRAQFDFDLILRAGFPFEFIQTVAQRPLACFCCDEVVTEGRGDLLYLDPNLAIDLIQFRACPDKVRMIGSQVLCQVGHLSLDLRLLYPKLGNSTGFQYLRNKLRAPNSRFQLA